MANVYEQFSPKTGSNIYEQFAPPAAAPTTSRLGTIGQGALEIPKGLARGAGGLIGGAVSALPTYDPRRPAFRDIEKYRAEIEHVPEMSPDEITALVGRVKAETPSVISQRLILGAINDRMKNSVVDPQAVQSLRLNPQEQFLYQHHLKNLTGDGKVINADNSVSTIRQITVERDGRTYNIPTVWNGKIVSADEAVKRAGSIGWDKWPSYGSEEEAQQRYDQMHEVMEEEGRRALEGPTEKSSLTDALGGAATRLEKPTRLPDTALYKAGVRIQEQIRKDFAAAPGWEDSLTATLSEGLGSVGTGAALSLLKGGAGGIFTAAGSGEALQRAVAFDEAERKAGRPGLTDEDFAMAGILGSGPGATDILPLEFLLGKLKVPLPLRKPLAKAVAKFGGQVLVEAAQEGGQQAWQNLIQQGYDPSQTIGEGVIPNAAMGGGVGGISSAAEQIITALAGRRGGRRAAPAPEAEQQTPAPESVPEGAAPAETLYPEPTEEAPAVPAAAAPNVYEQFKQSVVIPENVPATATPPAPLRVELNAGERDRVMGEAAPVAPAAVIPTPTPAPTQELLPAPVEASPAAPQPAPVAEATPAVETPVASPSGAANVYEQFAEKAPTVENLPAEAQKTEPVPAPKAEKPTPAKAPPAAEVTKGQKGAETEHPGLIIKSLETGKETFVQPPGTRQPKAKAPAREKSDWTELGRNEIGQTLYEDQRGVRSIIENGVRRTEAVPIVPTRAGGVEAATPVHKDEYRLTNELQTPPDWWAALTTAGRAPLIAKASSTLSPRVLWHNLSSDNQKKITAAYQAQQKEQAEPAPVTPMTPEERAAYQTEQDDKAFAKAKATASDLTRAAFDEDRRNSRRTAEAFLRGKIEPVTNLETTPNDQLLDIEERGGAQGTAARAELDKRANAPTWAEVLFALPKDEKGRPDLDAAGQIMFEISGIRQPSFRDLTADQQTEALKRAKSAAKETELPERPAGYGAKNKLVSTQRAEELRRRLRAKLRNQVASGIDPEVLAIGAELTAYHIEAGARKFADLARAIAKDLGVALEEIRPYLRSWYNGARDMMEDSGVDVAGMDSSEEVRESLARLISGPVPESGAVGEGGEPKTPADVAARPPERTGSDVQVAPRPTEDVGGAEPAPRPAGAGARPEQPLLGLGEGLREGGLPAPGRAGTGDGGLAAPDTGVGGRPAEPASPATRPNYFLADPDNLVGGGPKVRFARNRAALEAYRSVTEEGRDPTQAELDSMAAYIGWGSFGQELFQGNWERSRPKAGWEAEDKWLREHLGESEWKSAQSSIINAHYTDPPTVSTMWDMVRGMGFTGGRVLEPSMGIGNFFGLMPRDIMAKSDLTGIELDELTGGMAKLLYPHANVQIKGYEKSTTPDNFYDLVIGNWPFAADGPADRRYAPLSPTLHDFFFVKAMDQVRPGGIVIGITSAGTMDKVGKSVRMSLAKKAELIGAFRLPSGAFEKYAGTSVVTDIIVLKKREKELPTPTGGWLEAVEVETPTGEVRVNEYYRNNPGRILGTLGFGHGTTSGRPGMIVTRGDDFMAQLTALSSQLPEGTYEPVRRGKEPRFIANNSKDRDGSVTVKDGTLYVVQGDRLAVLEDVARYKVKSARDTAIREAQIGELVDLRRSYGRLIDAERDADPATESLRNTLRLQYEAFRNAHGPVINSVGLKLLRDVRDPFAPVLEALETTEGKPSRIMREPTTRGRKRLAQPSIREAFVMARNESTDLNMARVAEASGKTLEEVTKELVDARAVYHTPGGGFEVADVYLSGNVRRKLREARDAEQRGENMAASIDALNGVVPKDIPYFQIEGKLGATWISNERYREFLAHLLGVSESEVQEANVALRFAAGSWRVRFTHGGLNNRPEAQAQWGTPDIRFDRLFRSAMNNQTLTIKRKDSDGTEFVDEVATKQVNEKASLLRQEFSSWVWRDAERRVVLERSYNEVMNAIATPRFDGSFLDFSGMSLHRGEDQFSLRKHQVDAIWRGVANGRGLYAHEVGTGKTYTIGGIAVESRRYGLAKKPLVLAHNANSQAVANGIREMYPGSQVLYVDNLSPDTINVTMRRIANEDWDAVVMPHSVIDRLTLKGETLEALAAEQIAALEDEAMSAAEDDGVQLNVEAMDDETAMKKVRSVTAKELVKQRNRIKNKIDEMAQRASRPDAIAFEDLGIDMIEVDEVHEFKKPPIATKMRMRGLNTQTSNRSIMLQFLTGYVKQLNGGKGVHLFTGTPITNTLTEIFNQMRFVMDDQMGLDGVKDWDSWFNTFADATNDVELTATGEYEPVTRLAAFVNVAELRRMAGQFMDIVFADDMPEFKPRETASGKTLASPDLSEVERTQLMDGRSENPIGRPYKKIVPDVGPLNPVQERTLRELIARAKEFRDLDRKGRKEAMLSGSNIVPIRVETDAANASLDVRLFDPSGPDDPNSKVNRAVRNLLDIYRGSAEATQVVFVERGFSDVKVSRKKDTEGNVQVTRRQGFNLAKDLVEKLVAGGVKPSEIAIVDGSVSKAKREEIAEKMNRSEIRVVIGSTRTLGVGVNMQENLRAMHHLDAPWMPGDLEQRNGRGWRQGNRWNTVQEIRYITEKLDGRRWQVLTVKDRFIKAFLKADENTRIIEGDAANDAEGEDALGLAETLSEAAGDPRLLVVNKLRADIGRLEGRERLHSFGVADARQRVRELETKIRRASDQLPTLQEDVAFWQDESGQAFTATIAGQTFADRGKAGAALEDEVKRLVKGEKEPVTLGTVRGFTLTADWSRLFQNEPDFFITAPSGNRYKAKASIASVEAIGRGLKQRLDDEVATIADMEGSITRLNNAAAQPFQQQEQLETKRRMFNQVQADIAASPVPPPSWLRHGVFVDSQVFVNGTPTVVVGHRWSPTDYIVITELGEVDYRDVTDEHGMPLYDERPFQPPIIEKPADQQAPSQPTPRRLASSMEGQRVVLSPKKRSIIEKQASAILTRVAGKGVRVVFADTIPIDVALPPADVKRMRESAKSAGRELRGTIGGFYQFPPHEIIALALGDKYFDPLTTAGHEAWHRVETVLLNRAEKATLGREHARIEELAALENGTTVAEVRRQGPEEVRAIAFQRYRRMKEEGSRLSVFPTSVRRIFEKLANAFRLIRDMLRRQGVQRFEDVFEAARTGAIARRDEVGARPETARVLASSIEMDPLTGSADARNKAMTKGFEFQPVDRMLRLPFDIFGGLNQKGEWKPGQLLSNKTSRLITAARFSNDSRFSFMNPILHHARAGLIDRYGLDDIYVARDRKRQLEERAILNQVPELMKFMADNGMGASEAKTLHAMLVGEEVPTADFARISEPIRDAIDTFGAEAVELGLIPAESFERNRGKYLHRVYMKHENDQGGLSRWVSQMMGTRRKKIIGNELKGRGLWKQVPLDRLIGKDEPAPRLGARFNIFDQVNEDGKVTKRVYTKFGTAGPAGYVSRGAWEVRGVKRGEIVLWRDYTKPEREKMGEITDARYTIAKTYMLMAHDLAVGRFYRDISRNADWTSAQEPREKWVEASDFSRLATASDLEWVHVPDTMIPKSQAKRYGALAGKWVRTEIWRDINETEVLNRSNVWQSLLTQWKLNKALALDTPIPTPTGWTTMGGIRVGDEVFDEQGKVCSVLEVKDIAYDRPCYEVAFSDGTKIVADEEHLWCTISTLDSRKGKAGGVRTTKEILETLTQSRRGDSKHSIPVTAPLDLASADLPVAPYALGVWLGDGFSHSAQMCAGHEDVNEIIEHLRASGVRCTTPRANKEGVYLFTLQNENERRKDCLQAKLRCLGVLCNKHIPQTYLRGSQEQRLELLRGLMDTDGWIDSNGACGFSSSIPQLRDGALELLRSLGYKPTVSSVTARLRGKAHKTSWRIFFKAHSEHPPVFKLSRKVERLTAAPSRRSRSTVRYITSIMPVSSVPVRCIAVSSQSRLYLAGVGMVPTHNTARSPVVHCNNVMSNFVLMDMSGVGASDFVSGLRSLVKRDALYQEAEAAGAFGVDMVNQEIRRNVLQPILDNIEKDLKGGVGTLEQRLGILGKLADGLWTLAKATDRKMVQIYQLEDEVFRMALYARRRAQGVAAQEAADEARTQFIDYDIRAPWINAARRSVLPFISYTYRAAPLVARTVLTRPWKIAKYAAIAYGVQALSALLLPGDEDEERRSMREEEQGYTWLGAPRMIRMPFADDYGNPMYLDVRRWIPAGDIFDTNVGSSAIPVPGWMQFGGPLAMGAELMLNKQAFTGKEIVNDLTDDWWDRTSKVGDYLYKSWLPSAAYIPGSWYWQKVGNAITGARDFAGKPYNVATAAASSVGIKLQPVDVQENFAYRGIEFDKIERELKYQMSRLARDYARGLVSKDEAERQRERIIDKMRNLNQRRLETFTGKRELEGAE